MRNVYVWRDGGMVHKYTGEPMNDPAEKWVPKAPDVVPDTPGYQSPIDGRWIEGRRARRYDLESNDCVEAGDRKPKAFKNERFMQKWGLTNE